MTKTNVKTQCYLECKLNKDGSYEMRIEDHENYSEDSLLVKSYIEEMDSKLWFPIPVYIYKENFSDVYDENGGLHKKASVTRFVFNINVRDYFKLFKIIRISKDFIKHHTI